MSSSFGKNLRITVFGQSHSPGIGVVIDGLPPGFKPDLDRLSAFMRRRAPGWDPLTSKRRETDAFEILSGLYSGATCGGPLSAIIRNADHRPEDYADIRNKPRPGHADYTARVKYRGFEDPSGGGHLSGRLTAPICLAGGLAIQLLAERGVRLAAHIVAIGPVRARRFDAVNPEFGELVDQPLRALGAQTAQSMANALMSAARDGDSLTGEIELAATGLPAGLGAPIFDGLENTLSRAIFAIPGVKGIEFGDTLSRGSENNDAFTVKDGRVATITNHAGGILGGISNGMPIIVLAKLKPTPTISRPQQTVDLENMAGAVISVRGRHDPSIAPRAVACVEAAAAIALLDAYLDLRLP